MKSIALFILCTFNVDIHATEIMFMSEIIVDSSYVDNKVVSENITRGLLNVGLAMNLTEFIGKESFISASYALQRGDNGSDVAGDIQAFSNIDEADFTRVFEVILDVELSATSIIKLGQMDANNYFATTQYGSEFINSSMGYSPTILGMPTYPQPRLGLYTELTMHPDIVTRFGYYESSAKYNQFDAFLSLAEVQWAYKNNSAIKMGIWHHSGFEGNHLSSQSTNDFYLVVDHSFNERLSAFLQWGSADESVVEINQHLGFGLKYQRIFAEDDMLGIGVTQVHVVDAGSEQVTELFYLYPINEQVKIKPDIQYIVSPAGDKLKDDVLVFTLRLTADF